MSAAASVVIDRHLAGWSPGASCWEQFAAHAAHDPAAPAVETIDTVVTYGELARSVDRVTGQLHRHHLRRGTPVGVDLSRRPHLLTILLALLRAEVPYVPLDGRQPAGRLRAMTEGAGVAAVLTDRRDGPWDAVGGATIAVDSRHADLSGGWAAPAPTFDGDTVPAYVLHTSGTTGRPKGVEVAQGAVDWFARAMTAILGIDAGDRIVAMTALGFDPSLFELVVPLMTGAAVLLVDPAAHRRAGSTVAEVARLRPTIVQATPYRWRRLLDEGLDVSGLTVLSGGERMPRELATRLSRTARTTWNLYGPTETTVYCTGHRVEPDAGDERPVPLGQPLPGVAISIVDDDLRPVARGCEGQLAVFGPGLALGYRNEPDLTARGFVELDLDGSRRRAYLSGDLMRLDERGLLQFLGRRDRQVKLRGVRIECDEVEAAIDRIPGVRSSVVTASAGDHGEQELVAHVVAPGATPQALRRSLAVTLPTSMLPTRFVLRDQLPLNGNGKVDLDALARLPDQVAPVNGLIADTVEARVANVWERVLGITWLKRGSDFFELGGDSLAAVSVMAEISEEMGVRLSPATLLEASTIAELASVIRHASADTGPPPLTRVRHCDGAAVVVYVPSALGEDFHARVALRQLDRTVVCCRAVGLDGDRLPLATVEELAGYYLETLAAAGHEAPTYLVGFSMGGLVAVEMAVRLRAGGRPPALVALLDTYWPVATAPAPDVDAAMAALVDGLAAGPEGGPRSLAAKVAAMQAAGDLTADAGVELLRARLRVQASSNVAAQRYQVPPIDFPLWFFEADGSASEPWVAHSGAAVQVVEMGGEHNRLVTRPDMGPTLRAALDAVEARVHRG